MPWCGRTTLSNHRAASYNPAMPTTTIHFKDASRAPKQIETDRYEVRGSVADDTARIIYYRWGVNGEDEIFNESLADVDHIDPAPDL